MPQLFSAYGDLLDGLRSWYARKEGDSPYAAFSAISLLTALLLANLVSTFVVADLLIYPGIFHSSYRYRALIIVPGAAALMALHLFFAKKSGIYYRRGGPRSQSWARAAALYIAFTVIYLVVVAVAVFLRRRLQSTGHAV